MGFEAHFATHSRRSRIVFQTRCNKSCHVLNHAVFSLYCLICKGSDEFVEPLFEPLVVDVTCGLYLI